MLVVVVVGGGGGVVFTPLVYCEAFLAKRLRGKLDTIHRPCLLLIVAAVVVVTPLVYYNVRAGKLVLG